MEQLYLPFDENVATSRVLYYARDFPTLEKALLREVRRVKRDNPLKPLVVAVPSTGLGRKLSHLLTGGGIKVMNLKQLALMLCEAELYSRGLREIPPMGEELAARRAIRTALKPGSPMEPFMDSRGLLQVFMSLLKDFRQGGFEGFQDIEDLSRLMEREAGPAFDRDRMTTVFSMLDAYPDCFGQNFYDAVDIIKGGAESAGNFFRASRASDLLFYGFFNLDQTQQKLIQELSKYASGAVFFPYIHGSPASDHVMEFFRRIGYETREERKDPSPAKTALEHVRDSFLGDSSQGCNCAGDGSLTITSCPDTRTETLECARRVFQLASRGTPYHEITVVLRDREVYQNLLTDTFDFLNIPYCLHQGRPLSTTPAGATLALLLNLVALDLPRFEVMEFLCDGTIKYNSLMPPDRIPAPARWDQLSREAGVRKGLYSWRNCLNSLIRHYEKTPDSTPDSLRQGSHRETVEDLKNLLEVVENLSAIMSNIHRKGKWKYFSDTFASIIRQLIDDDSHLESLVAVVESLARLDCLESPVDYDTFSGFLRELVSRVPVSCGSYMAGCVNVHINVVPVGMTGDHLIVAGMLSGQYPAPHRDNPLMSDREREIFNGVYHWGGTLLLRRQLQEQEDYLTALLLGTARRGIHFSYPREGFMPGGEGMPSRYLLKIGSILTGKSVYHGNLCQVPGFVYADGDKVPCEQGRELFFLNPPELYLHTLRQQSDDVISRGILADVASLDPGFCRALDEFRRRRVYSSLTSSDGLVTGSDTLSGLQRIVRGIFNPASASGFEEYHACPYRFFLQRIMEISPISAPEEIRRISPLDRGKLYHAIYYRFYRHLKQRGLLPLQPHKTEEYLVEICRIARDEFEQVEKAGIVGDESSWFEKTVEISRGLEQFILEESRQRELLPRDFELSFGMRDPVGGGPLPAAEIKLGRDTFIKLRGRIDRVDASPLEDSWEIIDYKTGRYDKYRSDSFAGGTQLQLPLYLLSLNGLLDGMESLHQARALYYFATPRGGFKKIGFEGYLVEERKNDLTSLLVSVVNGAGEGFFPPYPGKRRLGREGSFDGENCIYCDYRPICPRDIAGIYQLKVGNSRLQDFEELKEIQ